jgi:RNA recognition motif-containing protein
MDQQQANPAVNSKKLFVGNLSWNLTKDDLLQLFSEFGTVEDAIVLTDKYSGRSKGFGFVTMSTDEEAQAAIAGLHEKEVDGRALVVNVAQPPRPREDRGPRTGGGYRGGNRGGYGRNDRGGDRGGYGRNQY